MRADHRTTSTPPAIAPDFPFALRAANFPSLSAAVMLFSVLALAATAKAETGLGVSGSSAQETWELRFATITVDWRRITLSPWWQNDNWQLSAELPFISRDAERRGRFGAVQATESDSGLGDSRLRATRNWQLNDTLSTHLSGYVKLPTGDENAGAIAVPVSQTRPTRQGQYALGTGSTDFGITPGATLANDLAWATAEAGYIFSNGGLVPQDDRPTAYLGIGLTPIAFIELSVAFDYEGEVAAGSGTLEQVTYTLTVKPLEKLSLSLSTYTDNSATTPDSNWSLGVSADW